MALGLTKAIILTKRMKKIKKLLAKLARIGEMREAIQALGFWELVSVIFVTIVLAILAATMLFKFIQQESVTFPAYGGHLKEGVVGSPNIFNPLLSIRDEDQEIVSLVFSGILRRDDQGGYINDLSEEVTRSKDGKTVTVKLKPELKFHNGDELNADDIIFTINLAKDPRVKSPIKVLWDSVTVTKQDDLTIVFSLKQPYAFFNDMLTLGIISEDVFKNTSKEEFPILKEHQEPIGAGPYRFVSSQTKNGEITKIKLKRFRKYEPKAYIKKISISYYKDENALLKSFRQGSIDLASGVSPQATNKASVQVLSSNLSRTFAIFINRKNVTYSQKTIEALNQLIPRELILKEALFDMGKSLYGPYPYAEQNEIDVKERVQKALGLLESDGWKHSIDGDYVKGSEILSVNISSPDTSELRNVGDKIITAFRDVGIQTNITYINPLNFTDEVVRSREFDFVLFGQVIHTPADLYAFWHSSQKNDPGLNIGSYTNKEVDQKLESLLKENDTVKQEKLLSDINNLIKNETGALFIFSPKYIVLSDRSAEIELPQSMSYSKDRYINIINWSIEKERVLKILNKNK